ncbi:unnamed protein product [Nyctereutes procyonoides]|uniref:(raccoon dog) hypothetical protein n=1 Tax=Nyctereutes procyonoides TaxID=34880 RepID=A0A811ZEM4_NYCPR|nr:unnamed protein product [Nyctereutes procyonoides]
MPEEWGRRLGRLGTGVTTSGAGLPSPGEDEELSRRPFNPLRSYQNVTPETAGPLREEEENGACTAFQHLNEMRRPPDSSHCGHRTRLHTPPPQTAARSLFTSNPGVGEGAPRQSAGAQRRRQGCSECLYPLCRRSRTQARSPTRPPAPAQCHCLSLWENGGDGGGGRGGGGGGGRGGGGGKCTGPARPAPQGQRGRGRSCPPPSCLWAAARRGLFHRGSKMANWRRRAGRSSVFFTTDAFNKSPKGLRRLQCADSGHRIKAELERPAPSRWRSEKRKRSGGEAAGKVQPPSAPLSCHRVSG